ncbi:MAG: PD-(D/E)XK nuclease family protein, partial [Nitrospirae bacterium]|nr:PD-(D/E)XK nuclease family protein [Nitrospirota bacterium]
QKNSYVVNVSLWLSDRGIDFISYSNLDVRKRRLTGEITALLSFLDSPPDDLSFAGFILGDLFLKTMERDGNLIDRTAICDFLFNNRNSRAPLYKMFQAEFPQIWDRYFSDLLRLSGYYPLYDLVVDIYGSFKVFETMRDEESALVKILEMANALEGKGSANLKDFIASAEDQETAESEWKMNVPKNIDAVKVMTIHKSKGLDFPVVIALLYGSKDASRGYIVDTEGDNVELLKVTKKTKESDEKLRWLYEARDIKENVNKLNTLYVGLTRAREEMYVIGVKDEKTKDKEEAGYSDLMETTEGGKQNNKYPCGLLPLESFKPSARPAIPRADSAGEEMGQPAVYLHKKAEINPSPSNKGINIKEKRRGEFIHKALAMIDYIQPNETDMLYSRLYGLIERVKAGQSSEYSSLFQAGDEIKGIIETILNALNHEDIMPYFAPEKEREVKLEQEFVDRNGRLFRMDRVVVDRERVIVIDFKTGYDRDNEVGYISQMQNYINILADIYQDKDVEGILAY